jgi:hypothetical protein
MRLNTSQYAYIFSDNKGYWATMKVTLTVEANELKLAQLLSKFAEKYRMTYKLNRQPKGFLLQVELNGDDFGEFVRRFNHLKDATYQIQELRGGGLLDKFNVSLTRTNVDALIGKEAIAKTDVDSLDGGVTKLMGELWLSRTEKGEIVKEGSRVRVIRTEGVSLIVEGVDEKK